MDRETSENELNAPGAQAKLQNEPFDELLDELRGATRRARRGERVPRERLNRWLDAGADARAAGDPAARNLTVALRSLARARVRGELDRAERRLRSIGPAERSTLTAARVADLRADLDTLETLGGRARDLRTRLADLCRGQLEGRLAAVEAASAEEPTAFPGVREISPALGSVGLLAGQSGGANAGWVWDDLAAAEVAGSPALGPLRDRAIALTTTLPLGLAVAIGKGADGLAGPAARVGALGSAGARVSGHASDDHSPGGLADGPLGPHAVGLGAGDLLGAPGWSVATPDVLATRRFAGDIGERALWLASMSISSGLPVGVYPFVDMRLARRTTVQVDWAAGEPDPWQDGATLAAMREAAARLSAAGAPVDFVRGMALPPESRAAPFAHPAAEMTLPGERGPIPLGDQPVFDRAISLARRPGFARLLVRASDTAPRFGADPGLRGMPVGGLSFGAGVLGSPARPERGDQGVSRHGMLAVPPPSFTGEGGGRTVGTRVSIGDAIVARSISSALSEGLAGVQFSLASTIGGAAARSERDLPDQALPLARLAPSGPSLETATEGDPIAQGMAAPRTRRETVRIELDWVAGSDPWRAPEAFARTVAAARLAGAARGVGVEIVRGREVHPATWNPTFARAARDLSVFGPSGPISLADLAALERAVPLASRPGLARFLVAPAAARAEVRGEAGIAARGLATSRFGRWIAGASQPTAGHVSFASGGGLWTLGAGLWVPTLRRDARSGARSGAQVGPAGIPWTTASGALPLFNLAAGAFAGGLPLGGAGLSAGDSPLGGADSAFYSRLFPLGTGSPLVAGREWHQGASSTGPPGLHFAPSAAGLLFSVPWRGRSVAHGEGAAAGFLFPRGDSDRWLGSGPAPHARSRVERALLGPSEHRPEAHGLAVRRDYVETSDPEGVVLPAGATLLDRFVARNSGWGPGPQPGGATDPDLPPLSLARPAENVRVELDLPGGGDPGRWDAALAEARAAAQVLASRGTHVEIARGREVPTAAYAADQSLPASSFVLFGSRGAIDLSSLRVLDRAVPVVQRPGLLRVIVAPDVASARANGDRLGAPAGLGGLLAGGIGQLLPGAVTGSRFGPTAQLAGSVADVSQSGALSLGGRHAGGFIEGLLDSGVHGATSTSSHHGAAGAGAAPLSGAQPPVGERAPAGADMGRLLPRWLLPVAGAATASAGSGDGSSPGLGASPIGALARTLFVAAGAPASHSAGAGHATSFAGSASVGSLGALPGSPLGLASAGQAPAGWTEPGPLVGRPAGTGATETWPVGALGGFGRGGGPEPRVETVVGDSAWSPRGLSAESGVWPSAHSAFAARGGATGRMGLSLPLVAGMSFPRPDASEWPAAEPSGGQMTDMASESAAWLVGLAATGASAGAPLGDLRLPTPPRRESLALASTTRSLAEPTTITQPTQAPSVEPIRSQAGASQQASLDQMARQVYAIIRQRLAVERERGGVRGHRAW